ncbi:hypothetical protein K443DRAFT_327623, partial [Laccaria amethystina LaAM-08-1]
ILHPPSVPGFYERFMTSTIPSSSSISLVRYPGMSNQFTVNTLLWLVGSAP